MNRPVAAATGGAIALAALAAAGDVRAACAGRPTDPAGAAGYGYGAAEVRSYATAHVRVFYAMTGPNAPVLTSTRGDGVPDTAALAGDTGEDALVRYAQMGFRAPVPDTGCPSNGGDAKTDIYLVKFAGSDGSTEQDACTGHACASWVLCESTFTGRAYADAAEGFHTVVPHELFHVVQNAYDAALDRFWAEGTAQWAMKTLRPELMDLEHNLPGFFSQSSRSIDAPPGGAVATYLYGAAIWPVFLTARYDASLVKDALDKEADGTGSLAAVDAAVTARRSSLAAEYPLFVAWNACTKRRAGTGGYPSAKTYPAITPAPAPLDGSAQGITTGLSNFTYLTHVDAASQAALDADAARNAGVLVPISSGLCELDRAAPLPATFTGDALVVVTGVTTKKTDAPFTLTIGPAPAVADGGSSQGAGTTTTKSGCRAAGSATSSDAVIPLVLLAGAVARRRRRQRRP